MLPLTLPQNPSNPLKVLCLGAHSDDIEIGCGGTILHLLSSHRNLDVVWVVFSSGREREREARTSAALFLKHAKRKKVMVKNFRDGFFPYEGGRIKGFFEEIKKSIGPDLIFTHYRGDRHQDHRTISDLTWNTWRRHLILEYEIPKYDGDFGSPNLFVPLSKPAYERKIETVLSAFRSQINKQWFSREVFLSIMRLRGMEANAPSGYAEGFYCRKSVLEAR